jgi:MFS transporter, ACS family, hexuronate transporter
MSAVILAGRRAPWLPVRWQIAWCLCLVTTINYIDRAALSFAAPVMLPELGISNTQYGLIASGFFWAYALGQVLSGRVVDLYGTKRTFSGAVVIWNLASAAHGLTRGFASLLGFRVILGLGEAANFPAATKAIAEWFPAKERSLANGILLMGPGLGAIVSPILITFLIVTLNWRWAFFISGVIGLLWLVLWHRIYHRVEDHPRISEEERAYILGERVVEDRLSGEEAGATIGPMPWSRLLRIREVWGLMLSRFSCDGAFFFFVTFLPLYFATQRDLDLAQIAVASVIPWIAADLGGIGGGWMGKKLMDLGWSVGRARKFVIWLGALMVLPATLGALMTESVVLAVAFISVALFAIQLKTSNLLIMPADLFHSRDVGTVWGIFGAMGSVGAAIFQSLVGWTIDNISWTPVFISVAMMHVVSAAIVMVMIPEVRRLR